MAACSGRPQELSESRLAGEHEGHDETRVHVEAGEDAQHGQRFGAQVMCLVEQDDAAHAVAGGVFESALQLAHQGGIDAGGERPQATAISSHRSRLERPVILTYWTLKPPPGERQRACARRRSCRCRRER